MLLMKEGDPATHARIHFLMDHTQVFVVFSLFFYLKWQIIHF